MTIFEETIYNGDILIACIKLLGFLLITILMVISSSYIIHVTIKLRNANDTLIINLLITGITCAVIVCYLFVPLIIAYLPEQNFYPNCDKIVLFINLRRDVSQLS